MTKKTTTGWEASSTDGGFRWRPVRTHARPIPELSASDVRRLVDKFKVTESGCWEWTSTYDHQGYGRFHLKGPGSAYLAHRVTYSFVRGEPGDYPLDHLCRNTKCVNPWHLERVTFQQNTRRGATITGAGARQTHCIRGHEFTPENTRVIHFPNGATGRNCRKCAYIHTKAYRERNRVRND